MLSDALRAVIVALSIVTCAIILSDIIEEEEILIDRGKVGEKQENNVVQAISDEFNGISMHDQILTGEVGTFESPNFPKADHNLDCIWVIRVDPANTVRLVVNEFDTEQNFDFLFVHDGDTAEHPLLLAHSGPSKPHPIRSTSNEMLVRFVTNNKISSRGFQAKYQSAPPCYTAAQFSNGLISSPNYPNQYDNNVRCDWLITVGPSEVILFELMDVDTEENQDFIEIFDGETDQAPLLQKLSGDYRENVLFLSSTSNAVLLRFTSDSSVSKSGFSIKFTAGSDKELLTYAAKEFQGYYDEPATTEEAPTRSTGPTEPPQENARIRQRSRIAELMKASNMTIE